LRWRALSAHYSAVNTPAIEARFGVMVNGHVAEVKTIAVHAVLALDDAHDYLVNARVVAGPPPSERWYRLLDEFDSKAATLESAPAGPSAEVGERADLFARSLFVASAAFLAAEANDLEDRISLLDAGRREETRARLDGIADKVGDAADALIGRVEDGTWQEFSDNISSGSRPSQRDEARLQPTPPRYMQAIGGRAACSAAAGSAGAVITIVGEIVLRNGSPRIAMLGVAVLLCVGGLLGTSWTSRTLAAKFRQLAGERRRLNEGLLAIRTARRQEGECPRCACPLSEWDWYPEPTVVEERSYDDD
jgi:hypothetical protein